VAGIASANEVLKLPLRSNILWITCEDIAPDLGCYGDTYARTPWLDAFSKQAVRYARTFATAPVCAPCARSWVHSTRTSLANTPSCALTKALGSAWKRRWKRFNRHPERKRPPALPADREPEAHQQWVATQSLPTSGNQ
jgi:hypothetical protein